SSSGCSPMFFSTSSCSPSCACSSFTFDPRRCLGRCCRRWELHLSIGNLFYAYLAWQLAKKEGRTDVTAMLYGASVPHTFIVVLVIMLPVFWKPRTRCSPGRQGVPDASSSA